MIICIGDKITIKRNCQYHGCIGSIIAYARSHYLVKFECGRLE